MHAAAAWRPASGLYRARYSSIAAFSGPFKSENVRGTADQFGSSDKNLCPARLYAESKDSNLQYRFTFISLK